MKIRSWFAALLLPVLALAQSTREVKKTPLGIKVRTATTQTQGASTMSPYTTYDFNWQYVANLPACESTNVACFDGFQMTNTTTGTLVGTPAQIGPTTLSWSYTPSGGIPYGTIGFSLVAHGYDETGASVVSAPATTSITVKTPALSGPTNLQSATQ